MSETPQETLTTYLHRGYIKGTLGPGEVREAIRAVLDLVRVQYEANEEMTRLLTDAQADVSQMEGVARGYMLAAEKAEAEVERLERARLRSADWLTFEKMEAEVERLRAEGLAIADGQIADRERLEAERDEWRDTARNEMAGRAAAEAALDRVTRNWGWLNLALREWREAESWPDCAACSVLDAALAGAKP